MPTLIRKVEAAAAERLKLPAGRTVSQEIPRFKTYLKVEGHRLKLAQRAGASGLQICQARAVVLDQVIRALWESARSQLSIEAQKEFPPIAVLALGGYGRGELNPHSDLDIMFLHEGQVVAHQTRALPHLEKIMNGVLMPLWDLGFKIGHAVRSIEDCVEAANSREDPRSMETKTSFVEARLIIGHAALFKKFQQTFQSKCVKGHEAEYIQSRLEDQRTRRAKYGNSACMQEPNIKNGCGGLRDYQNLIWMTWFKFGTRSLEDLEKHQFITRTEREQLDAAYDYLLRVRNDLHTLAGRPVDALTKSVQPAVARSLGFTDVSISRRLEKFMRRLYFHMRNIFLITRTVEQRLALDPATGASKPLSWRMLLHPLRSRKKEDPVDGFLFAEGKVMAVSPRVFQDQPRRLMRVFLHAQQRGLVLHPDLAQIIRNRLDLVDRRFMGDGHVRETFLTLLNHRGMVGGVLRQMHEVGLLGKYLPEFGKLTCLVQHEFYHQYAADEHTLQCLEQVDRVWESKNPPHSHYFSLLQSLERPSLLYLALLLHDTGKADGHGHHSEVGMKLALRAARRLHLDAPATRMLQFIIDNHLLPARTSQLRDLDDPSVIRAYAAKVGNLETLTLLTLHTFADSLATSDKLWTSFKDSLLWTLHRKTSAELTGGTGFRQADAYQREALLQKTRSLADDSVGESQIATHFQSLPPRYFQIHRPEEIIEDISLVSRLRRTSSTAQTPAASTQWTNLPDRGCSEVKICTRDRPGLFGKIAGSLSATGLNILGAQIFTRQDEIALDTFLVTDARSGSVVEREQREKFDVLLIRVLAGKETDLSPLIARHRPYHPLFQSYEGERIPTRITIDNDSSLDGTAVEVETEDRVGLLYTLAQTFRSLDLSIWTARICTEKGAAIDSFLISTVSGGKLDEARHRDVEKSLHEAIQKMDEAAEAASRTNSK